jgi:hypothetical protein
LRWARVILALPLCALAHDPISTKITWSREVSRVVFAHCASCHREGGSSFPLITYKQARPWAVAIKDEVLERRMPPWGAVEGFGDFRDDESLTGTDLEIVAAWAEGGAPEGDPALLPPAPGITRPPPAPMGTEMVVNGRLELKHAIRLVAIRPAQVPAGVSLQVTARRPDGSIEPLLWLVNYQPRFPRTYVYREPVLLPTGTVIETSPPGAGTLVLTGLVLTGKASRPVYESMESNSARSARSGSSFSAH